MAGTTGLEPATSDVTGRRSNQLNYVPAKTSRRYTNANTAGARAPNRVLNTFVGQEQGAARPVGRNPGTDSQFPAKPRRKSMSVPGLWRVAKSRKQKYREPC